VPDHGGRLGAHVVEEPGDVARQLHHVVVLDRRGRRRTAVAALIRGQHVVPGGGERGDLVTPREGQFREAVRKHDDGRPALTGLGHAQRHAVGLH
jgi:hypothetical protein